MNHTQFSIFFIIAFVLTIVYCGNNFTPAEQCSNKNFDNLRDRVQVIPCSKSKCKLHRGTNVTVIFKFNPKHEVKSLTNDVYAKIGGLPLPFVGVHGVNACTRVTRVADGSPAPCPLAPDQEYTYTSVFYIESFYPAVHLQVHWGLNDGKRDVICFEVPAVIMEAKRN